jgi:hypothetical protein
VSYERDDDDLTTFCRYDLDNNPTSNHTCEPYKSKHIQQASQIPRQINLPFLLTRQDLSGLVWLSSWYSQNERKKTESMDRGSLDLTEQIDAVHIVSRGRETAGCCRMVLGEEGLAVSLNTKMLLMNGKFMSQNILPNQDDSLE